MEIENLEGQTLDDFKLLKRIGKGSFGVVYEAQHTKNHNRYAIKVESSKTLSPQLNYEYDVYYYLHCCFLQMKLENHPIPKIHGIYSTRKCTFVVMDLLGKTLNDVFRDNSKTIQSKKALGYAKNMFEIMENVHRTMVIYRDIKPQNFIFVEDNETSTQGQLKLVDFGLSLKLSFYNQRQKIKQTSNVIGTLRYASINAHEGKHITKLDDLQSVVYVLIYLMKGSLPWQSVSAHSDKEKEYLVLKMKKETSVEELCEDLPKDFQKVVNYIKFGQNCETIDYEYIQYCLDECIGEVNKSEQMPPNREVWGYESQFMFQDRNLSLLEKNVNDKSKQLTQTQPTHPLKICQEIQQESQQSSAYKKLIKRPQLKRKFFMNDGSNHSRSSSQQFQQTNQEQQQKLSKFMVDQ